MLLSSSSTNTSVKDFERSDTPLIILYGVFAFTAIPTPPYFIVLIAFSDINVKTPLGLPPIWTTKDLNHCDVWGQ